MGIELFKVSMSDDAPAMVADVLRSGYIGQGPKVEEFEALCRGLLGNDHVLTVNSCTTGLEFAFHLLKTQHGWGPDTEILCTPMTCFATVAAILANGLRVRWVDVDDTLNIDLTDLRRKLTPNTRAAAVVHWGGLPLDPQALEAVRQEYGGLYGQPFHVVEDCAHAWGSKARGEWVGAGGNIAVFSFQAIKSLTTGDGGLMVLPPGMYRRAKLLRWFGLDREAGASFRCVQNIPEYGFKYHLNDIAAVIGIANFQRSLADVRRHQANAAFYDAALANVPGVRLIARPHWAEPSYWLYTLHVGNRTGFIRRLAEEGVAASPVHARCDTHDCVRDFRSPLPSMDRHAESMVCIPVGWWVTDEDRRKIAGIIQGGW